MRPMIKVTDNSVAIQDSSRQISHVDIDRGDWTAKYCIPNHTKIRDMVMQNSNTLVALVDSCILLFDLRIRKLITSQEASNVSSSLRLIPNSTRIIFNFDGRNLR
jgi:hypothetical protein